MLYSGVQPVNAEQKMSRHHTFFWKIKEPDQSFSPNIENKIKKYWTLPLEEVIT